MYSSSDSSGRGNDAQWEVAYNQLNVLVKKQRCWENRWEWGVGSGEGGSRNGNDVTGMEMQWRH